ncbi:MAG: 50S ribosomal protein L15 [Planctomycetaceae bacterium]|nr:50S ribosomal protein L15 [Planctomycetaceae bacterium]
MKLHDVNTGIKKHKRPKRLGRGPGSGHGKTAGRGHKGQGQLAGWTAHPAFEGGQMPLARRIPKRGFNNQWARVIASLNVGELAELFAAGEEVTPATLRAKGLLKKRHDLLKILGHGELTIKLKVAAHRFSETARAKIEQAGGEVVILPGPQLVSERAEKTETAPKAKKK